MVVSAQVAVDPSWFDFDINKVRKVLIFGGAARTRPRRGRGPGLASFRRWRCCQALPSSVPVHASPDALCIKPSRPRPRPAPHFHLLRLLWWIAVGQAAEVEPFRQRSPPGVRYLVLRAWFGQLSLLFHVFRTSSYPSSLTTSSLANLPNTELSRLAFIPSQPISSDPRF